MASCTSASVRFSVLVTGVWYNTEEQDCVNQELIQPLSDSMSEGPLLIEPTTTHTHTITCQTDTHTQKHKLTQGAGSSTVSEMTKLLSRQWWKRFGMQDIDLFQPLTDNYLLLMADSEKISNSSHFCVLKMSS